MSKFVLTAQLQLQAPSNVGQVVQQIQSQLNGVTVNIKAQGVAQAQQQVQNLSKSMQQATGTAANMGRTFALSVKRFAALSVATRAVSLFTNTISKAVDEAISFERQLVKISQVTGSSISDLGDLVSEVTRLSTGLGVSSRSLLNVAEILAQAGLSAKDTKIALDSLAKSELAPTFDNITATAEGAVAILAQFKQGSAALEGQLGSLNAVAGKFAVEAGDLVDVIRRTGGVFKASGGNLNELISLFTSVRATTRESAESIATGLRTIFTRIQRPKTIEYLKQFGVELVDLEGKFVGPFEAIKRLSEGLRGLGEGDITFIKIAEELGGFRQIGKVIPLLREFKTAQDALNVAEKGSKGLAQDAATAQLALAVRITKVKEEFLALARGITETKSFQVFANTALNLASSLIKLADALKPLIPLLTAVAAVRIARGLGSFIGGFKGGVGFNQGGVVRRFATGGLVPGSGSGDKIPSMLEPGEFVMQKTAVNSIGAGNLSTMNRGGKIQRFVQGTTGRGVREELAKITKTPPSAPEKTSGQYGRLTQLKNIPSEADDDTYGAAFLRPGGGQVYSGLNTSLTKDIKQLPQYKQIANIARINNDTSILPSVDEAISKYANKNKYKLVTGSLTGAYENKIEDSILQGIVNTVTSSVGAMQAELGISGNVDTARLLKRANIDQTVGNIFESTIAFAGRPYSDRDRDGANDPYDFTTGLGPIANKFNFPVSIGNRPTDAKTSINSETLLTFTKKTQNQNLLRAKEDITPYLQNAFNSLKGKELSQSDYLSLFGNKPSQSLARVGLSASRTGTRYAIKANGGLIQKFAIGGSPKASKKRGFFFDFDDTLATTGAIERPGTADPYSDFRGQKSRQLLESASATRYAAMAKRKAAQGNDIWVLTARPGDKDTVSGIRTFGSKNGLNFKGVIGVGGISTKRGINTASAKATILARYAKNYPDGIIFFDDLRENALVAQQQMKQTGTRFKSVIAKKNTGGSIARFSNGSVVPALVSNGEGWIPPESVNSFGGYSNLNKLNNADRNNTLNKASGGKIGIFKGPGSGTSDSIGPIGLDAGGFVLRANAMKALGFHMGGKLRAKKYANGGFATMSGTMGKKAGGSGSGNSGNNPSGNGITGLGKLNEALFGVTFALSSLTPVINENSTAFEKGMATAIESATFLSSVLMGVSALLTAFGVDLSKMKFGEILSNIMPANAATGATNAALSKGLPIGLAKLTGAVTGLGIAAGAGALAFYGVQKSLDVLVDSIYGYSDKLKASIGSGNVAETATTARDQQVSKVFINSIAGATAGIITFTLLLGPLGVVAGAAVGALTALIATDLPTYASALAASQAAQIKTQKELTEATDRSIKAMKDFEAGNISAVDVIKSTSGATQAVETQREQANILQKNAEKNKYNAIQTEALPGLGTVGGAAAGALIGTAAVPVIGTAIGTAVGAAIGGFGLNYLVSSKNARTDKQVAETNKQVSEQEKEVLKTALPNLEPLQRQFAAAGGSFNDFLNTVEATDQNLFAIIQRQGTTDLEKSFQNLSKEAERTRKAFDAMNLGFQNVSAASAALGTNLDNYMASQQSGNNKTESTIRTLEASVTNAAQGISDADFSTALGDASDGLRKLGASETQVKKFQQNLGAINTAQKFFASASEETKNKLKADFEAGKTGTNNLQERRGAFANAIGKQLEGAGIGEEARKRISDALANSQLSDDDMNRVMLGDFSALDKILKDLGDTTLNQVKPAMEQYAKYQNVLTDLTQKRIDSENKIIEAQRGVLDAQLEAQEIIGKYGGKAVTSEVRRQNVIAQANVQRGSLGVAELKTGSAAEFKQRNADITKRLTEISTLRQAAAAKNASEADKAVLQGQSGKQLEAEQQRLTELAKSDYETTKKLIQLKEDELKLIGEKNKLEKDSISALISGDADKFFELQQAKGAQAAIATGSATLQSAYGPAALGMAAQDIQRQQEAGVTELYGQQLGGAGGLTERGFRSALGARGVNDARMAQVAAGTTMEEEMAKQDIRSLAETLPNNAETQLMVAKQDQETADIQFKAAEMQLEAAVKQVEARSGGASMVGVGPAQGKARGGLIYANRGIFVPRGTDTVPAMLTPGEFVVRREAVQRGNNLQLLRAINTGSNTPSSMSASSSAPINGAVGMAKGGIVKYYADGDMASGGLDISKLESVFTTFNTKFQEAINSLSNVRLNIKLDATNVNVNLTGGEFLMKIKEEIRSDLMKEIGAKLSTTKVDGQGNAFSSPSITNSKP